MLNQNWRVTAAVALGLGLAAFALVVVLSKQDVRLAGTNSFVQVSGAAVPVRPHRQRCSLEMVPDGGSHVVVYAGTFGRPGQPVSVTVLDRGRVVSSGRVAGRYPDNTALQVPLHPPTSRLLRARVCVRNLGARPMQFAGNLTPRVGPRADGEEAIRLDWLLPGRQSWAGIAPRVATRFAATKPTFVGTWTFWMLGGVLAILWAGAIALVLREGGR